MKIKPEIKKYIKWGFIALVCLIGYGRWNSSSLEEKVATLICFIILIGFYLWSKEKDDERRYRYDFTIASARDEWLLLRMEYLQNPEEFKKKYAKGIDDYHFPFVTRYFKEHMDDDVISTMEREGIPNFHFYD